MKLDSNFSGFSVNEASFRSQVEGKRPHGAHGGGGAKKACCGRGCCEQGKQKIALDDLSGLLKATEVSLTSTYSQKSVQEKPRRHEHHDFDQASAPKQKPHNDADFDALFKQLDSSSTFTPSTDSQSVVQEKPRHQGHHRSHGDVNKVEQNTVTAQAV